MAREWTLITGASGGIGLELAKLCAQNSMNVILVSRDLGRLETSAASLKKSHAIETVCFAVDLSKPGSASDLYRQVAGKHIVVDNLINNAGVGDYGDLIHADVERLTAMNQLNILSLTELTRYFGADMAKRGRGRILNVASTAAFQPMPSMAAYAASKSYVLSFTEAVREELSSLGVTVTCLAPGPTATGFASAAEMTSTRLFSGSVASSETVARIGMEAMLSGKRLAVVGAKNQVMAMASKTAPRKVVMRVTKWLMAGK